MYIKIKGSYLIISILLLVGLFSSTVARASGPDSPVAPGTTNSFTLEDLYQRLNAGIGTIATYPAPVPAKTGQTTGYTAGPHGMSSPPGDIAPARTYGLPFPAGTTEDEAGTLAAQAAPPVGQSQPIEAGQTPDGLSAAEWESIQAQIAAGKYRAYAAEAGGYGSSTPAHGWQIAYGADGLTTLTPRDLEAAPWQWGLQLTGYGYDKLSGFETPAGLQADGPNLTYHWDANLSEWWHNTTAGLEQGFTVVQRPPGAGHGRPLVLEWPGTRYRQNFTSLDELFVLLRA